MFFTQGHANNDIHYHFQADYKYITAVVTIKVPWPINGELLT